ncbi:hypothetical protein KUCAC02_023607, partial [Chaenocephalus aceratus]
GMLFSYTPTLVRPSSPTPSSFNEQVLAGENLGTDRVSRGKSREWRQPWITDMMETTEDIHSCDVSTVTVCCHISRWRIECGHKCSQQADDGTNVNDFKEARVEDSSHYTRDECVTPHAYTFSHFNHPTNQARRLCLLTPASLGTYDHSFHLPSPSSYRTLPACRVSIFTFCSPWCANKYLDTPLLNSTVFKRTEGNSKPSVEEEGLPAAATQKQAALLPTRQASQLEPGSLIGLEGPCQPLSLG